ncbi:enterobactin synthetase component F [Streptomyces sp. SAI-170]|uniref:amino acid adenylation domain-containing protein n=1 Tax=Streptomyces sp. SAI-170 TaxID=3377729 RepID=UPI003C7AA9B5
MDQQPGSRGRRVPLTTAQTGMWFAQQLDAGNPIYRAAEYVDIHGPVDLSLLRAALRRAVADTEALRVRFETDDEGEVWQVVDASAQWTLPVVDLREPDGSDGQSPHSAPDPWERARRWMWADLRRTGDDDLRHFPLFRFAVLLLPDDHCLLYLRIHHIALDGYGFSLFIRRVADVYTALAAGEPCPASPFGSLAELVADESEYQASERFTRDRAYWADQLAARPAAGSAAEGHVLVPHRFVRATGHVPAPVADRLRALARRSRSGLPAVAMAAMALYVHRLSGTSDVMLDLTVTGRVGAVARNVPSMVVNVLPLQLELEPATTVADLVRQTSERARGLLRHQRYPLPLLVRDLGVVQHTGGYLADWGINIMGYDPQLSFGQHAATLHNLSNGPVTGLGCNVYERAADGSLRIDFNADPDLYDAETTAGHLRRFLGLLDTLADTEPQVPVDRVEVLLEAERRLVTSEWNGRTGPVETRPLPELFEEQTRRTPDAIALVCGATTLTYEQLNARANRLAHELIARGAGPETYVALALPRTAEYIVALLAVLKSGAASVPVDPDLPAERIRLLLDDTRPQCVLTTTAVARRLPPTAVAVPLDAPAVCRSLARRPDTDPRDTDRTAPLTPDNAAYVSYTSGSTGRPKGVVVEHRQLSHLYGGHRAELIDPEAAAAGRRLKTALTAAFSFDTFWEGPLFLTAGHELHLIEDAVRLDPAALVDHVHRHRIDFLDLTPTYLHQLLAAGLLNESTDSRPPAPRHRPRILMVGGEPLDAGLWQTLRAQTATRAYNYYGPTECTVDAIFCCLADRDATPVIGRPGPGIQAYVLDNARRPVPPGVPGELYLAGNQLARGYLNQPELTAERFLPNPFGPAGTRMYRTGDLVRWTADGVLEHLGRTDAQIKLRGFRIEPGEIAAVLARHPDVAHAEVTKREDAPGDPRLTAYVVPSARPTPERPVDATALRTWAADHLPAYMVPSAFVSLSRLPLTANGKLDRAALPAPAAPAHPSGRPPGSPEEKLLCALFAEVLNTPHVGVDDNFFTLGGHSLLAAKLLSRIRATLDTQLSIRALFEAPTVAGLARLMATGTHGDGFDMLLPLRTQGSRPPLFCIHPSGGLSWCYAGLLRHLPADLPVYGLQARGLAHSATPPTTFEEMVTEYVAQIRGVQPTGPYHLLGWSLGGALAHATGALLRDQGERVDLLTMLDSRPIDPHHAALSAPTETETLALLLEAAGHDPTRFKPPLTVPGVAAALRENAGSNTLLAAMTDHPALDEAHLTSITETFTNFAKLLPTFVERVFDGDLLYFHAAHGKPEHAPTGETWRRLVTGRIDTRDIPCTHHAMTQPAPLARIGREVAARLDLVHGGI